jgi:transposase InsO family protein
MWSIDANECLTDAGNATVFVLVNRCTSECVGVRAAVRGSRFEAMKFLREAAWATKGHYEVGITRGTSLRHDHGSQFIYHALRDELKTLGIESRPPFDRQPEGDGWAERFIRALKVQLLSLRRFGPVADLGRALREFRDRFSQYWIIGRIGCQSYPQDRCKLLLATPS